MTQKPSYKELVCRVRELEDIVAGKHPLMDTLLLGNRYLLLDLIENSGTLIVIKDRDGKYLLVNRKWEQVTGLQRETVLGKTDTLLFSPEMARQFRENDLHVIESGSIIETEECLETPTETRYFISNKFPLLDNNGKVAGLYGVITEITDLKRVEKALQQSQLKYQSLFDGAQVALFRTSTDGKLLEINNRYAVMAGYSSVEQCMAEFNPGKAWSEPSDRAEMVRILRENRSINDFEARIIRKDGEIIWILFSATIYPEQGYIEGSIVDITERKQAEQELRDSEARFNALHNASFGGIAIHDNGIILECNQGLSEITGHSVAELMGMNGLLLIAENSRKTVMEKIVSGYEKPYEAIGLHKDGTEFPIRLEARNIPYKGKVVRTVEFRDLSESKRSEEEKKILQDQLIQAQKMESVGRLAGGVAHDFNNMLAVILGHTEMALVDLDPALPLHASLQAVQHAAERSAALTRQLLAFARKQTVSPKIIDLNETVEGMLKMLRRLIGEDINLRWQPGRNLKPVKVDPSQIDQLLANLCVNARDAIAGVGKVTIETDVKTFDEAYCADHLGFLPGEYVLLEVSDDGCGIDKNLLNHIFEPFFTTKEQGKGTGLGLASVFGMVKQNNGFINVYSEPGQGTTFKIYLPAYAEKATGEVAKVPNLPPEHGHETVLLVEDEPAILAMTTIMLSRLGYTVVAATSPGEAIRLAHEHRGRIDLLMTDVVMPEMNGRELAGNLLSHYPDLKRLFMSGYTANVIAHHGVLDEGVHFIQKPFSMSDLGGKLREALKG